MWTSWKFLLENFGGGSRLTHRLIHLLYEETGIVRDDGCRWWFAFHENAKKCFIIIRKLTKRMTISIQAATQRLNS